jgi:PAS domain S-box-containing protein
VEGRGLTPFKKISEYVISAIFAASAIFLRIKRRELDPNVYTLVKYSIVTAIVCEVCFTLYNTPDDIFNLTGHIFKVVSFYFMYSAIVETGIKNPSALIFKQLKVREAELLESRKTLSKANDNLREAQRLARVGNFDWDLVTNEMWWSDEIFELLGGVKSELEVSYESFLTQVHPDDLEYVKKTTAESIAAIKPFEIEFRCVLPGGAEKYSHVRAEVFAEGGRAVRISGTAQDVTERKLHEKKIEEYNVLLKKTLSSLNEAVFIVDPETRIIHECNETAEKIFGYTRQEMIGKTTDFLHVNEEAYREFGRMLHEAFDAGENLETEYRMKRKNGEIFASEHLVTSYEQIWGGGG